jgi:hypothetical protein
MLRMDCHSAMYFYEKGECILNKEHRKSVANGIFRKNNGTTELVDYFDNVCADGKSPKCHLIRIIAAS